MKKLPLFLILLGILLLITCAALQWIVLPMFYGEQVVQGMRSFYGPTGSSEHYKKFGLPSPAALDPTLLSVYIFNVTNPRDIIQSGLKPQIQEVGPYVYIVEKLIEEVDDHDTKVDEQTESNDDADTITFREKKIYHFSQLHSGNLSELDELYVLNIPFLKAMEQSDVHRKSKLIQDALLSVHKYTPVETSVFIKRPVKEILFSGFYQPALDKLHKNMDKNNPPFLHEGKFGFFYPTNGTESKLYKVHSGLRKRKRTGKTKRVKGEEFIDYGQIIEYDGKEDLHYWANVNDNKCNKILGSPEGMLFAPLAEQGSTLFLFRPEICRSVRFEISEHIEYYGELEGHRYILPPELLYDSKDNFEDNCFCPGPEVQSHNKSCRQNGTLSNCSEGFPFITSLPHFLHDKHQYVTQTIGLSPNRSKHESFVDLEPITGLALKSSVKFQLNYELSHSTAHDDLNKIPESGILFPLVWTDEIKSLNFILSGGITQNIIFPLSMVQIGKWVALALGLLLIAAGILVGLLRARKKSYPIYFNTLLISRESKRNTLVSPKQNRKVSFSNGNSKSKSKTTGSKSSLSQGLQSKMKQSSKKNSTSLPQMTQSQIDLTEPLFKGLQRQQSRLSIKLQHAGKSPSSLSTFVPPTRKRASSVQLTTNNNGAGHKQQTMASDNSQVNVSSCVSISGDNDNENGVTDFKILENLDETKL